MDDQRAYDAYLLSVREPDEAMPDGWLEVRYIAVKRSLAEAVAAVRERRSKPCTTELLDSGSSVSDDAKRRGLRDDDVGEV